MNIQISKNPQEQENTFALFNLGFRVFFLAAAIFSIIAISLWGVMYVMRLIPEGHSIPNIYWHAHEMIYGYSMAAVAGFLLTAVKNWTGVQTINGKLLFLLFLMWALARILFLPGIEQILLASIFDTLFGFFFLIAISQPVIKVKQWTQIGILSKILLLVIFNLVFYLAALGLLPEIILTTLYGGLYLVISLVMLMARRVMPFFIERGVGYEVKLFNSKWLDNLNLVLFTAFFIADIFFQSKMYAAYFSLGIFIINVIRLVGWHTKGIWKKPLLWSLYLAYGFIALGFLLFAGSYFLNIPKSLAIHALAFGGIGLITISMMSRVSLGHTGRDINRPSKSLSYAFFMLIAGSVIRVILPLFDGQYYVLYIGLSTLLWLTAFIIFTVNYLPILIRPRIDGQPG